MFTFIRLLDDPVNKQRGPAGLTQKSTKKYVTKAWFTKDQSIQAHWGSLFDVEKEFTPTSLGDLSRALTEYAKNPQVCMVQHALPKGAPRTRVRRVKEVFSLFPKTEFMVFDVDEFPLPEGIEQLDIEAHTKYVLGLLNSRFPQYFNTNMRFISKGSSSAGIKLGQIRIHLFLENATPVSNRQVATIVDEINAVFREEFGQNIFDPSVYNRAAVLYTATPLFLGSLPDPFEDSPRMVYKKTGSVATFPPNTKEKSVTKATEITQLDLENQSRFTGTDVLPTSVIQVLEDIRQTRDNVLMAKSHRLVFTAMEAGVCFNVLEEKLALAMVDHPKIKTGEMTVQAYLQNGLDYVLGIVKSRAIREVPQKLDITVVPKEEVSPEDMKTAIFSLDVERIALSKPPEGKEKFLHVGGKPPQNKITFLKASLGSGKTTYVNELRRTGALKGKFLSITNRTSLVASIADDFNDRGLSDKGNKLPPYKYSKIKDRNDYIMGEGGSMATTIHSLHYFQELAQDGGVDVVFIDECDAVLDELFNAPNNIMRSRDKCRDALSYLLGTAKYVILADGDINEDTMFGYFHLCADSGMVKDLAVVEHKHPMLAGAHATEVKTEETLWVQGVHCMLDEGKKVLVVTDSGPEQLNTRMEDLQLIHPEHNFMAIHSESRNNPDIVEVLNRTTEALIEQDLDCVICSPTVVSGVDFHYFDVVCLLTNSDNSPPNLRFQALRRCRKASEFFIYTSTEVSGFSTGYRSDLCTGWYNKSKRNLALRKEEEFNGFIRNLRFMLMDQGCTVTVDSYKEESLESIAKDMTGEAGKDIEFRKHLDAIMTATEGSSPLYYNDAWEEKKQVAHYLDLDGLSEVTEEHVAYFLTKKIHKRMEALGAVVRAGLWSTLFYQVSYVEDFVTFLQQNGKEWYTATGNNASTVGKYKRLRVAKSQARRIGLDLYPKESEISCDLLQVKEYYRKYCQYVDIPIPREFMTASELAMALESKEDLSLRAQAIPGVQKASTESGAKDWASFMENN